MNLVRPIIRGLATAALLFLGACVPRNSCTPVVPVEATCNEDAGTGGLWGKPLFLTLRLEGGEELTFNVDTGAPVTVLDRSLQPRLGKRLGTKPIHYAWRSGTADTYPAPRLYLGDTRLQTGDRVWTDDLSGIARPSPERPIQGILGMDCLRHYALQLDFSAKLVRFRRAHDLKPAELGKAFSLAVNSSGHVTVGEFFAGTHGVSPIIDTGCACDAVLEPAEFQRLLQTEIAAWTNEFRYPSGFTRHTVRFPKLTFGGESYTNVFIDQSPAMRDGRRTYYLNAIGLPFLARHLVTFDFPDRKMYLKRSCADIESQAKSDKRSATGFDPGDSQPAR
jgi:hypothetical protein